MPRWAKVLLAVAVLLLGAFIALAISIHRQETRRAVPLPQRFPLPTSGALPSGQLLFDSDRGGGYEIYSMTTTGTDVTRLTNDPTYDSWWPQISPDRQHVIFYRTPRGTHDKDLSKNSLWVMDVHGKNVRELMPSGAYGWVVQGHAMFSPNGQHLVMFAGSKLSPQIWVTDADGRNATRLTDRGGVNIDPSYSPDGSTIAFVGCPHSVCFAGDYEIYTVDVATKNTNRVTTDGIRDQDPVYSPDAQWITWLSETSSSRSAGVWNIRKAHPDGSDITDVTNDKEINSKPAYSPDGSKIFFHRLDYDAPPGTFQIWEISPDGSGLRQVGPNQPGNNEYPAL